MAFDAGISQLALTSKLETASQQMGMQKPRGPADTTRLSQQVSNRTAYLIRRLLNDQNLTELKRVKAQLL